MEIYRAMCNEEAELWITGKSAWLRRFKWFSPNIDWVRSRVMGGTFNNSKDKPNRYTRLLVFEYAGESSCKEIQLDRRCNPKIRYLKELK